MSMMEKVDYDPDPLWQYMLGKSGTNVFNTEATEVTQRALC